MIKRKVRVRMPKAQSGLEVKMRAGLGFNANQLSWPVMAGEFSEPDLDIEKTLKPVEREEANLEAEVGETAVTNLNNDGIPEQYKIGGKRHYDGGTPLNLPDHSYIFSRDKSMKIKDPAILEQFGITNAPRGGVTPADIAKKYDLNKYKKVLFDKESDDLARDTAEMMISNYIVKLGKLAIVQESMKNFPEGIPLIAMPYLESIGVDPEEFLPSQEQIEQQVQSEEEQPFQDMPTGKYGMELPKYQTANPGNITSKKILKDSQGEYIEITYDTGSKKIVRDQSQVQALKKANSGSRNTGGGGTNTPSKSVDRLAGIRKYLPKVPLSDENRAKITTEFDPRLSEEGNESYNNLVKSLTGDQNLKDLVRQKVLDILNDNVKDKNGKRVQVLGKNVTESDIRAAKAAIEANPDYAVDLFLKYQKQNYLFKELREGIKENYNVDILADDHPLKIALDDPNNTNKNNELISELFKYYGYGDEDIINDDTETLISQAATWGLVEIEDSDDWADTFQKLGLNFSRRGQVEDKGNLVDPETGLPTFSQGDKYYGNNTIDVTLGYGAKKKKERKDLPPDDSIPQPDIPYTKMDEPVRPSQNAPWWLQDIIKMNGDMYDYMNIKKYMPWQATPAVDFMEPEFYSPERELAANAEQLAIGAQGAAQFTGPQSFNARYSQMAGKAATNAADILARYNNLNVGVANQTEKFNVDTFNEYAEDRADDATALFDKVSLLNQNYDNAKNEARQNMRQSYIDAITNAAQAASLNALYPNFAVYTPTGGTPLDIPGWGKPKPNKPAETPEQAWARISSMKGISQSAKEKAWLTFIGAYDKEKKEDEDEQEAKVQTYPGSTGTTKKK